MSDILIHAYEWLICLGEAVVVFLLFKNRFNCTKPRPYLALAGIPVIASCTFVMNLLSIPWAILALISIAIHLVYAFLFFDGTPTLKYIWVDVPFVIFCVSNYLCLIVLYAVTDWGGLGLIPGNTIRVFGQLFYTAINFSIAFFLMRVKNEGSELPAALRAGTILLSFIGIAVAMYCFSEMVSPGNADIPTVSWMLCTSVLVLSAALLLLSGYLSRLYHRQLETQKELQKTKLEAEHVSQVSAMYDHVRGFRHDMSGMISTVLSLAENGEYESMKAYLREMNGAAEETRLIINTSNPAIDATVSAKLMLADNYGIKVEHTVSVPKNINIDSTDVCSVIMNLMDNAIEAVCTLPSGMRKIDFSMIDKGGMLSIGVKNTCIGSYHYDGGKLLTTKNDGAVHGIGLTRVGRIAAKHDGFMKVEPKQNSFEVNVLLPIPDKTI
ncbi:MAG: GHKL domain-containing protein [Clostridia bacterium]|nr:GHKL domain-containing protein [Clostridia bacterium]